MVENQPGKGEILVNKEKKRHTHTHKIPRGRQNPEWIKCSKD